MTRRHDNHTWIQADAQGEQTKSTNTLGNSAEWGREDDTTPLEYFWPLFS